MTINEKLYKLHQELDVDLAYEMLSEKFQKMYKKGTLTKYDALTIAIRKLQMAHNDTSIMERIFNK